MTKALYIFAAASILQAQSWNPEIPKTWDDEAVQSLELPLAGLGKPATHVSSEYYYRIPVRKIYKTYPIDDTGREPAAYLEWLKQQEPEVVFDPSKLKTEADWIRAGQLVWQSVITPAEGPLAVSAPAPRRRERRYVIRTKGRVENGDSTCAECHVRYLADGTSVIGAQGKSWEGRGPGLRKVFADPKLANHDAVNPFRNHSVPWLSPDPLEPLKNPTPDVMGPVIDEWVAGTFPRPGTSPLFPPVVPDLIGIRDRKYFDATGLIRHRSIGDLMRYAALVTGIERLARYDGFRFYGELPDPTTLERFSDEQLYALALYVYSLKPPENPNKFDAGAARGQEIFEREGCAACHTPPLYTNNMLTPVEGFKVPEEHRKQFAVLPVVVGTDTRLALQTRKGTGYYRVPSLKGVWYRAPFEHSGSVATLEDWFDPNRLRDDYVPTGFKGFGVKTRAVKGHEFGLKLNADDKQALIAFLKAL
ncbi:MAG: hypothetical protein ACRD8O_23310 [Bryobacteraceae bacterium]